MKGRDNEDPTARWSRASGGNRSFPTTGVAAGDIAVAGVKAATRRDRSRMRVALIGLGLTLSLLGLCFRLFQVQVVQAEELADQGLSQRLVTRDLAPQRGKIYDRNGELLAMTVEAQSIWANPSQIEEPLWVAQQIGGLLDVDSQELLVRLESDKDFVYLKRQVEPGVAEQILGLDVRGIYAHPEATRIYPAGTVASHVTGFVDIDGNGQEGLEYMYDESLRGIPGKAVFERDLEGRIIPQGMTDIVPAVPGIDLNTTIDLPLQYQTQQACLAAVDRTSAASCWVVVLDVETGGILAMSGAPVFDPQARQTIDENCDATKDPTCHAFKNFIVRGVYEPGSTQKLITVAAALEEGEVKKGTVISDVADVLELRPDACRSADDDLFGCYRDFEEHDTANMTVAEVFTRSSNVGTILIADTLGQDRLVSYIERFGLGSKTGVDYSVEAPGMLNFEAGCETCWASAAIGYSVAATPLQMAAAYAAIGNDGIWTAPHIVASTTDVDGDEEVAGLETRKVVSEDTAVLMQQLLANVVDEGTGQAATVDGYRVGGKTGTANKLGPDGRYTEVTRASFVGMAPMSDPKVVVAVLIDAPSYRYRTGGAAAAPVFAQVMEQALHRLGVAPDAAAG
jgi:cell division protein FtsI/penicillin-binding protein 2